MSVLIIKIILGASAALLNVLFQFSFFGKKIEKIVGSIPLRFKFYLGFYFVFATTFLIIPEGILISVFNEVRVGFSYIIFIISILLGCLFVTLFFRKLHTHLYGKKLVRLMSREKESNE